MKINIKSLPKKVLNWIENLRPYTAFIFIMVALVLILFLVLQIRLNVTKEPSSSAIQEKLLELKKTKIDQDVVDKIQQLEQRNIEVKSLFKNARDNPFQD